MTRSTRVAHTFKVNLTGSEKSLLVIFQALWGRKRISDIEPFDDRSKQYLLAIFDSFRAILHDKAQLRI